jgi:hypothetical protein
MTQDTKDRVFSIIRYLLSAVGAYFLGRQFFGQQVTSEFWEQASGVILVLISVVWGFVDKSVTIEGFQGAIRQVWAVIAGILIGAGKMNDQTSNLILGILGTLSAWVYSWLSKKKTMRLANPADPLKVEHLNGGTKAVVRKIA